MSRLAVFALLAVPAVAPAQGFNLPYRTDTTFFPPAITRYPGGFYSTFGPMYPVPAAVANGGVGYLSPGGFYHPGYFTTVGPSVYYVPSYAGDSTRLLTPVAPPLVGAGMPSPQPTTTAGGQTAELRLELPAAADVWVNGKLQPSRSAARTLSSPSLPAGGRHTFAIKAAWTATDGTKYEWDRTVTVAAGGHSKVAVAAGFKAKD